MTPQGGCQRSKGCYLHDRYRSIDMADDDEDIRSWDGVGEESMG
jgi:hypothetical protein